MTRSQRSDATRSQSDRGATAVEFALILPLLAVLIFGLIDMGRLFYVQMSLEFAANEGARVSSLYPNGPADTATVPNIVNAAIGNAAVIATLTSGAQVSVDPSGAATCSSSVSNENTTVLVTTQFKWLTPIGLVDPNSASGGMGGNITLRSTGVLRCIG